MGPEPDGLGLREDEQAAYLTKITGKGNIKDIPVPGLQAVVNDARARLAKRIEEGR